MCCCLSVLAPDAETCTTLGLPAALWLSLLYVLPMATGDGYNMQPWTKVVKKKITDENMEMLRGRRV